MDFWKTFFCFVFIAHTVHPGVQKRPKRAGTQNLQESIDSFLRQSRVLLAHFMRYAQTNDLSHLGQSVENGQVCI
jgi:hypothetical protein